MKKTILVIDDDKKLNRLLKDFLGEFGFHTLTAAHPVEGLAKLRQKSPELVILDVMLPEMNGFEATSAIRNPVNQCLNNQIPIIALTANAQKGSREECLKAGMDDYLTKPVHPKLLMERIGHWLEQSQSQRPVTGTNQ